MAREAADLGDGRIAKALAGTLARQHACAVGEGANDQVVHQLLLIAHFGERTVVWLGGTMGG